MGVLAAAGYGVLGALLLVGGYALRARATMAVVPLYDPSQADDPAALARVVGLSLLVFGVVTLAFAALEALALANEVVVAGYAVAVMLVAILTATQTRKYE